MKLFKLYHTSFYYIHNIYICIYIYQLSFFIRIIFYYIMNLLYTNINNIIPPQPPNGRTPNKKRLQKMVFPPPR